MKNLIIIMMIGGYIGGISVLLGYPITTWQFWFVTTPISLFCSFVMARVLED